MCAMHKLVTTLVALELALPEEVIPKHVCLTQYQLKVFKNVDCFMPLHMHNLDKAGTLLFHNSTMQR